VQAGTFPSLGDEMMVQAMDCLGVQVHTIYVGLAGIETARNSSEAATPPTVRSTLPGAENTVLYPPNYAFTRWTLLSFLS
jgi:hypothetical protein